jgi:hypothetical protein
MKKLIITFSILFVWFFCVKTAESTETLICANCHTMFDSQDFAEGTNDSCILCHTTSAAIGPRIDSTTIQSAGSFNDIFVTSATNTHNVQNLIGYNASNRDPIHGNHAPGGIELSEQLKCAGTYGCHGNHDDKKTSPEGIHGYHHSGGGYKSLEIAKNNSGIGIPVDGYASPDYEAGGANEENHNIYISGPTGISSFCNNCHDDFHGIDTTGSETEGVWTRHPTDVEVANLGNLENITVDYNNTPFGFTLDDVSDMELTTTKKYTVENAKVTCLTCHRAHASPYPDILRFDYESQVIGNGNTTGCLACHTRMR